MKYKKIIGQLVGWGVLLGSFTSCDRSTVEELPSAGRDSVRVEFYAPGYYSTYGETPTASVTTRAFPLEKTLALSQLNSYKLEEGASVWVSYQTYDKDEKENVTLGEPKVHPYVVSRSSTGDYTLYACGMSDDGNTYHADVNNLGSPLYLSPGTYYFRSIYPAVDLTKVTAEDGTSKFMANVDNGMYLCSNDNRYKESGGTVVTIKQVSSDDVDPQYVTLNPMVQQTARIQVEIYGDEQMSDLNVMAAGVEISGLQDPYNLGDNLYNWSSDAVSDTLCMRLGDKHSWVTIPGSDFTKTEQDDGTVKLTGDVGVLPTDALSTVLVFLFNLEVDGIATQYMTTVQQIRLYHAQSYRLSIHVKKDTDKVLIVAAWMNVSWTADVEPISNN
jgi:hypothetical protein